jgi:hypothetical protein
LSLKTPNFSPKILTKITTLVPGILQIVKKTSNADPHLLSGKTPPLRSRVGLDVIQWTHVPRAAREAGVEDVAVAVDLRVDFVNEIGPYLPDETKAYVIKFWTCFKNRNVSENFKQVCEIPFLSNFKKLRKKLIVLFYSATFHHFVGTFPATHETGTFKMEKSHFFQIAKN